MSEIIINQTTAIFSNVFVLTRDIASLMTSLLAMFGLPSTITLAMFTIEVSHIILLVLIVATFFGLLKVFPVIIKTYILWFVVVFAVVFLLVFLSSLSVEDITKIVPKMNRT